MANQFSWDASPGAVNYLVTLVNTATKATINHETTNTFISLVGIPSGTYKVTVKADMGNGSTSIIVEDVVQV